MGSSSPQWLDAPLEVITCGTFYKVFVARATVFSTWVSHMPNNYNFSLLPGDMEQKATESDGFSSVND